MIYDPRRRALMLRQRIIESMTADEIEEYSGGTMKLRCSGGVLDGQMVEVANDVKKGDRLRVLGQVSGKPTEADYEVASDTTKIWLVSPPPPWMSEHDS